MMQLPGGLLRAGALKRELWLRDPDGELELRIAEAPRHARSFHDVVSRVLSAAVEDLGGSALSHADAHELCVGDRQFLMQRVSILLGNARQWIQASCAECEKPFEVDVDLEMLPVGEAGAGFPFVEVETRAGKLRLRVPSGADQSAIEPLGSGEAAERELLRRCVVDGELPARLPLDDIARIDAALEAVSPWVVTELAAPCPECKAECTVPLDPYASLRGSARQIFDEVHALASHYHWSEAEILALPRARRQLYLSRIDRARGLST
jgi:hypothetical protein